MKPGPGRERRRICHFYDCERKCLRGHTMCGKHKSAGGYRRHWEITQGRRGNNPKTGEPKEGWPTHDAAIKTHNEGERTMPRGQNRAYIIVIKDLVNGWEFLEQDNLSRPLFPPRWSRFAENAQRFPRKQNAQYSLTQIKKRNRNCQMAVMCPVGETR